MSIEMSSGNYLTQKISDNYERFKKTKFNSWWWGRNRPEVVEYERKMTDRKPEDFPLHPKPVEVEECGDSVILGGMIAGSLMFGIFVAYVVKTIVEVL